MSMSSSTAEWTFSQCPTPPDWTLEWPAMVGHFPWLRAMAGCPQDAVFHAEGDVLTHTRLVVEALIASDDWRALPDHTRSILFAATLLHDIGKPSCTVREAVLRRLAARLDVPDLMEADHVEWVLTSQAG